MSALSTIAPALLTVEKIDWVRNSASFESLGLLFLEDILGSYVPKAIESSLLISEVRETDMVLLIPPQTNNEGWQTWFVAHWVPGEIRFPSFRHYLEYAFENMQTEASA
jgi:hypothetical protein